MLSEVIAHPDESKRRALFVLFKKLLNSQGSIQGNCIMPYNWIVEMQAKAYMRNPASYQWSALNVRFREAEEEVAREEIVHSLSEETRRQHREWEEEFKDIYRRAKPAFQQIFVSRDDRPSLKEVTEKLLGEGGAHLQIGANLIEKATGRRPTVSETRGFIDRCPPFKNLLISLCFSQYDRCIREDRRPSLGKAGRVDMYSSVYLSYCDFFITNDDGQLKALKEVAKLAGLSASVSSYAAFTGDLFVLAPR